MRSCCVVLGDQDGWGTNRLSKAESILGTGMSQNLSRGRRHAWLNTKFLRRFKNRNVEEEDMHRILHQLARSGEITPADLYHQLRQHQRLRPEQLGTAIYPQPLGARRAERHYRARQWRLRIPHPNVTTVSIIVTADSKENPGIGHVGVEYAPPPFQARELKSVKNKIVGIKRFQSPPAFSGEGTQKREK